MTLFLEVVFPVVFEPDGARAATATDHANRNLITSFVLNNEFGKVAVQYFANLFLRRIGDD